MAKVDKKMHEARMAGAAWILKMAKEQGMEAAEKELRNRGACFLPFEVSTKALDEAINKIKLNTIDTVLIMACMTLHDEFGFGHKRLLRFKDRFDLKTECICDGDVIWDDFIETLKDETGIELSIRKNE